MSVIPHPDMFYGGEPVDEHQALKEVKKDLESLKLEDAIVLDIITKLENDPDSVYSGSTKEYDFAVMKGLNGQYLVKKLPRDKH